MSVWGVSRRPCHPEELQASDAWSSACIDTHSAISDVIKESPICAIICGIEKHSKLDMHVGYQFLLDLYGNKLLIWEFCIFIDQRAWLGGSARSINGSGGDV